MHNLMIIRYIGLPLVHFPLLTGHDRGSLVAAAESACRDLALDRRIDRRLCGEPFLTEPGRLIEAVSDAVDAAAGYRPGLSTGAGTSDGRFVAPTGAEVVELGPVNAAIHSIDERVLVSDPDRLKDLVKDPSRPDVSQAPRSGPRQPRLAPRRPGVQPLPRGVRRLPPHVRRAPRRG